MQFLKSLSVLAVASASLAAHAGTWSANQFTTGGASASLANSGVTATISAYSNAPGTTNTLSAASITQISNTTPTGVGVQKAGGSPADAAGLDNSSGIDALLINFSTAQVLSNFRVGQSTAGTGGGCAPYTTATCGNDSDVSLLMWVGGVAGPVGTSYMTIAGSALSSSGWALVGNYSNAALAGAAGTTTGAATSSSWWLITAYNSAWGGALTSGDDCVDVLSFATGTPTTPGRTPEPASLALVSLALLGVGAARRKARA